MSLRNRFRLLFVSIVGGFVLFGLVSAWALETLRVNGPLYSRIVQGKNLVADIHPPPEYIIESYLVILHIYESQSAGHGEQVAVLAKQLETLKKNYDERYAFWSKEKLEPELQRLFLKTAHQPALQFYDLVFGQFLPQIRNGNLAEAENTLNELERIYESHRKAIDAVVTYANKRNEADEAEGQSLIVNSFWILLVIFAVAVVGTGALAFIISRSVLKAIGGEITTAAQVASKIADGDLSVTIPVTAGDSDSLFAAMAHMRKGLSDLVRGVQRDAQSMATAAESMASLADQLRERVASQSDSSASMATAIEELSVSIRRIADNSQEALSFAAEAGETSRQGVEVLTQVATKVGTVSTTVSSTAATISELQIHSERISTVTQVIHEVAEQTNLLALNASIEAARAGESGRGFAVVADEVRKLAERTGAATAEISQIIDAIGNASRAASGAMQNTVVHTEAGVKDSLAAQQTIAALRSRSEQVSDFVRVIGEALKEQDVASENLSSHVASISALSEQNLAAAQTAAHSAHDLSSLAESLHGTATRFRLS